MQGQPLKLRMNIMQEVAHNTDILKIKMLLSIIKRLWMRWYYKNTDMVML